MPYHSGPYYLPCYTKATQPASTRVNLIRAATILGHQRVTDTAAVVASISTIAKAAHTAQFIPWTSHELIALDVPLNHSF